MLTTTLNRIREHSPCEAGWRKLLAHSGKTRADDEPLPYSVILESIGLDDALDVAERYAHGQAADDELAAARAAAWAAWDAARAAWDAGDVAWDAAWDAARDAQSTEFLRVVSE